MLLSIENRRLWWKELRQMVPLVILLLSMVPIMLLIYLIMDSPFRYRSSLERNINWPVYFVLGLPGIFAIGVGGLLIGQEKELRTLNWLTSLPISPRKLIASKLNSGLLALFVIWLVCAPIAAILIPTVGTDATRFQIISYWLVYSLFLLTWSLAIHWRIQSVFVSLMTLIGVAIIPSILFYFIEEAVNAWHGKSGLLIDTLCIGVLIALALIGWRLVHRFGLVALSPERSAARAKPNLWSELTENHYRTPLEAAGYYQKMSPWSALGWQSFAQNRRMIWGLFSMMAVAGCMQVYRLFAIQSTALASPQWDRFLSGDVLPWMLYQLAGCWLGILAFQGDSHLRRITFLADRGISPASTWWTRHWAGIKFMLFYLLLFTAVLMWMPRLQISSFDTIMIVSRVAALLLVSYTISQWLGQLVRGPIAAALLAPIISWLLTITGLFYLNFVGCPVWLLFAVGLVPWMATWLSRRIWMDQRSIKVAWVGHGFALVLMLVLPVLPGLLELYRTPRISPALQAKLKEFDVGARGGHYRNNYSINLKGPSYDIRFATQNRVLRDGTIETDLFDYSKPSSLRELNRRELDQLARQLEANTRPLTLQYQKATEFLTSFAELTRLGWKNQTPDPESLDLYRSSIRSLYLMVQGARRSNELIDQEKADRLEIFLLDELQLPNAEDLVGASLMQSIVETLGDREARKIARRHALANSYFYSQEPDMGYYFGGYRFPETAPVENYWFQFRIQARKLGTATEDLWQLLHSEPGRMDEELVNRIARFWGAAPESYQCLKSVSDGNLSAEKLPDRPPIRFITVAPGIYWHGTWELEAEELRQRYRNSSPRLLHSE
jgi:hypothetical protein